MTLQYIERPRELRREHRNAARDIQQQGNIPPEVPTNGRGYKQTNPNDGASSPPRALDYPRQPGACAEEAGGIMGALGLRTEDVGAHHV